MAVQKMQVVVQKMQVKQSFSFVLLLKQETNVRRLMSYGTNFADQFRRYACAVALLIGPAVGSAKTKESRTIPCGPRNGAGNR
jgi:hypothetical protein